MTEDSTLTLVGLSYCFLFLCFNVKVAIENNRLNLIFPFLIINRLTLKIVTANCIWFCLDTIYVTG